MYRAIIHLTVLSLLFSCSEEVEERDSSTPWGIQFSTKENAGGAYGYLSRQNSESNEAFLVNAASVRAVKGDLYRITFNFTSHDSLRIIIAKRTDDFNFNYPQPDSVNQLLLAIFNTDTLRLNRSSISIEPQPKNNTFYTVTNLNTRRVGSYNGTIEGVPLLE